MDKGYRRSQTYDIGTCIEIQRARLTATRDGRRWMKMSACVACVTKIPVAVQHGSEGRVTGKSGKSIYDNLGWCL